MEILGDICQQGFLLFLIQTTRNTTPEYPPICPTLRIGKLNTLLVQRPNLFNPPTISGITKTGT
ncbi:Uncharacterised protein [Vibrio cholerae]|nr:Uncharacterised protein [Vibrio cholerae]CSA43098.1 Uncharacterised protein [Vibrio cholerae]